MKRQALKHPKTLDLSSRLNISLVAAVGHLTFLFDFVAEFTPQGNIGKFPDGAIARASQWDGDATQFVAALVDAGWIDRDEHNRLVVHDWAEHCENWVRAKLRKLNLDFIKSTPTTAPASYEPSYERSEEPSLEPSSPRDQAKPSQAKPKPSQAKPSPKEAATAAVAALPLPEPLDTPEFRAAWSAWISHRSEIKKPLKETQSREQLETFARWGPVRAIAAIRHTIRQGWQGLREPESEATRKSSDPRGNERAAENYLRMRGQNGNDANDCDDDTRVG